MVIPLAGAEKGRLTWSSSEWEIIKVQNPKKKLERTNLGKNDQKLSTDVGLCDLPWSLESDLGWCTGWDRRETAL